ncbi:MULTISPECIES: phospholipase effector Tle1 domain-containing protein [Pseudomonas]|uniref:Uncharacterized protein n=1 Tax=Pseudomonas fluorescens TaxID=294 RepID=A0A5E6S3Z3_PSEFL|nr:MULTISPECIES: DUF2235 domain-containing protein [Pseudomonas]MBF4554726.1 DUF2235 domain-containing protein [Pseudomonas sp. p50(2008)]MCX2897969.1 DUF2235 domain-containing protein [Pseudomonas mandelii]VVM75369.1 hypothetical protein PS645_01983 [Pseudomonas fluorescens]
MSKLPRNYAVLLFCLVLSGCSSLFSGSREVPISEEQKTRLHDLGGMSSFILPRVNDGESGVYTLVVAFDGTNNDLFNTPDSENATVVGRLYQDVVDEIRKGSEKASIPVDALSAIYYRGPGCPSWVACPFDSAIGWSTWLSARRAVADVQSKIANLDSGVREIRVVVIGFSRGAATSRYFLNLLASKPLVNVWGEALTVRSYALLFDTVATGMANYLDLALPANLEFAYHFVAQNETRKFFGLVVDADEGYESNPLAKLFYFPQRIVTIEVPGAHSDLGDSYKKGAGMAVTQYARMTMARMGLRPNLKNYNCALPENSEQPGCRVLDEGLHDSRGTIDLLLRVPSPYGCFKYREKTVRPSQMNLDDAMNLTLRRYDGIGNFPLDNGNLLRFQWLENYRFISLGGPHPVLYPRISDIGFNAVVVPVGERLKVVLRGANNDQVYTVPERILQRVRETSGRSELELNLIKGEPRWIVNGCMPDED